MQCLNLLGFQLQVQLQSLPKKLQRFYALSKDNKTIIGFFRMPIEFAPRAEQFKQSLVPTKALWRDSLDNRC
jgi:hypothetical protein